MMILTDETNIRDVIAFPKNQRGIDVMFQAPSPVVQQQLDELGLDIRPAIRAAALDEVDA